MATEREAWLALTVEEPLEPDLPICDAHHHLWDRADERYMIEEFVQDTGGGHNVVHTVFLQCGRCTGRADPRRCGPWGETEFVQGVAALSASGQYGPTTVAAAIVGFADLTLGAAVQPVLEAHMAASRDRFRGVRHTTTWDASPDIRTNAPKGLLLDTKFREGYACLQKLGLSFDSWLYHHQLTELADLARAFPDVPIIMNHVGVPSTSVPTPESVRRFFRSGSGGLPSWWPAPM